MIYSGRCAFRESTFTNVKRVIVSLCICIAVLSGCTKTEEALPQNQDIPEKIPLLIGLIPERNIFNQLKRYELLSEYLSKKIGISVQLKILTRYENIINNFVSMGLDGAFFGSFTYTLAHARLGVELLARPEDPDGVSTYYGLIFARKDSNIRNVHDMKDKIFACVDHATTAGHLLPMAYFKEHGILDFTSYLKENYYAGTHEDAIYDVLNKKADIGAAKNTVFHQLAASDKSILEDLIILKRSPDVPSNGLAVRNDMDDAIKGNLKNALLNMHHDPEGLKALKAINAVKFISTSNDDYKAVYEYLDQVGLNPAEYKYTNR